MPQNLDLTVAETNQGQELRADSEEIISKYTTQGTPEEINAETSKTEQPSPVAAASEELIAETDLSNPEINPFINMFDPKNFEKKEDNITTIVDLVTDTNTMLGKILGVESANGITSATIVDAVNQNTMASASASINAARSLTIQSRNQTENLQSLQGSDLTGIA